MNVPNEDIPVRVDDTHKVNAEHEDVVANIEYDSNCCVRNDSDENKTERSDSDEDIWYDTDENDDDDEDEPTFHDSGMWVGDVSFDHHNEADTIANDPINAPLIEIKFYKPRQRSS